MTNCDHVGPCYGHLLILIQICHQAWPDATRCDWVRLCMLGGCINFVSYLWECQSKINKIHVWFKKIMFKRCYHVIISYAMYIQTDWQSCPKFLIFVIIRLLIYKNRMNFLIWWRCIWTHFNLIQFHQPCFVAAHMHPFWHQITEQVSEHGRRKVMAALNQFGWTQPVTFGDI